MILALTAAATTAGVVYERTETPRIEDSNIGRREGTFNIMGDLAEGTWKHTDGTMEQGKFRDGRLTNGVKSFEDGKEERGCFVGGVLHGEGVRESRNPSGEVSVEIGNFVNGKLKGGKITTRISNSDQGSSRTIFIENGQPTGIEERTYTDKKGRTVKEYGHYTNDKLSGNDSRRVTYGQNGSYDTDFKEEGMFVDGKLNGPGKISDDSFVTKGNFVDGKLDGKGEVRRTNGELIEMGTYKAGALHGHGERQIGNESESGEFVNGKLKRGKRIIFGDGADTVQNGTFGDDGDLADGHEREGHNSYGIHHLENDVKGGERTLKSTAHTDGTVTVEGEE